MPSELLQAERARDPGAFDAKVHRMHEEIMTALAEMIAREDPGGHCGLCQGSCVKHSLPEPASVLARFAEPLYSAT